VPSAPPLTSRLTALALWPFGVALTSWNYMWRTTPLHRRELEGSLPEDSPPPLPPGVAREGIQAPEDGAGPLFHRRYRVAIAGSRLRPEELFRRLVADLNQAAPTEFARFHRDGEDGPPRPGDEYVVHMPGPWNGPVRVVAAGPALLRLATLERHLEAGQIEFRAAGDGRLVFEIESWARSGDRVSNLLYQHLRMAKEIQLHMWTSFLERVVELAGGRRAGGIEIETRRVDPPSA
jgi:uncharacterized protein DUF1990